MPGNENKIKNVDRDAQIINFFMSLPPCVHRPPCLDAPGLPNRIPIMKECKLLIFFGMVLEGTAEFQIFNLVNFTSWRVEASRGILTVVLTDYRLSITDVASRFGSFGVIGCVSFLLP